MAEETENKQDLRSIVDKLKDESTELIKSLKKSDLKRKSKELEKANKELESFSNNIDTISKIVDQSVVRLITKKELEKTLSEFTLVLSTLKGSVFSNKKEIEKLENVSASFESIVNSLSSVKNINVDQNTIKFLASTIDIIAEKKDIVQKLSTKRFAGGIENINTLMSGLESLSNNIKVKLALENIDKIADSIPTIKEFDKLEKSAKSLESIGSAIDSLANPIKTRLAISSIKMLSKHLGDEKGPLAKLNKTAGANISQLSDNIDKLSNPIKVRLAITSIKMLSKHLGDKNGPLAKLNEATSENIGNLTSVIDNFANPLRIFTVIQSLKFFGSKLATELKSFNKTVGDQQNEMDQVIALVELFSNPLKIAGVLIGMKLFGGNLKKLQGEGVGVDVSKPVPEVPIIETNKPVTEFVKGGSVTEPTQGIKEEARPETVAPLTKSGFDRLITINKDNNSAMAIDLDSIQQNMGEMERNILGIKFDLGMLSDKLDKPEEEKNEDDKKKESSFLATIAGALGSFLLNKFPFLKKLGSLRKLLTLPGTIFKKISEFFFKEVPKQLKKWGSNILKIFTKIPGKIIGAIGNFLSKIPGLGAVGDIAKSIAGKAGKALDFGKNVFGKVFDAGKSIVGKGIDIGKTAIGKVGKVVKALNPIEAIKKVLPKVKGLLKGGATKILKGVPILGPLITAVQTGILTNDARASLAGGKSPRAVALETIPGVGEIIGQTISGGVGLLGGPIASIVGAMGGGFLGNKLAKNFAPDIADALGFTEEADKKFFANASKSKIKVEGRSFKKQKEVIAPFAKQDVALANTDGIPKIPEVKSVDDLSTETKQASETSHSREANEIIGQERAQMMAPIIIQQGNNIIPQQDFVKRTGTVIPSSEDTNYANAITKTRILTAG